MIAVTDSISIPEEEIQVEYVQSSGPGGQNVNKVATAAQLRYDVRSSPALPEDVRRRLERLAGKRLTAAGVLVIEARRFRTQEQNRQDAIERLVSLVRKAAEKPKERRKTRPTAASVQKRLETKRRRSEVKRMRQNLDE